MGHDHQESSSSGAIVAIVIAVLLVAILGIVAVAGAGLFWVKTARMESRTAIIAEQRAVEQVHRARAVAQQAVAQARHEEAIARLEQSRVATTPGPRLNFDVAIDRLGNASIDGEVIGLDELQTRIAKLMDETSNAFSVRINADPECPVKLLIPVLDACEEVGDVDYRVVSSEGSVVQVTATVASYEPAAEWDHFDDGTFSAYDKLTLKVVSPERHAGKTFSVTVPPTEFPDDSAFRTTGTGLSFTLRESDIGATGLAWGAIDDPTIEQ